MAVKILFDILSTAALIAGFSIFGAGMRKNGKRYVVAFLFVTAQMLILRHIVIDYIGSYAGILLYLFAIITYAIVFNESIIRSTMVFIISLLPIIVIETILMYLLNVIGIETLDAQQLQWPRVVASLAEIATIIVIKKTVSVKKLLQPIERFFTIFAYVFINLFLFLLMMKVTIDVEIVGSRHNSEFLLIIVATAAVASTIIISSFVSENQKTKRLKKYNELKQAVEPLIENNMRIQHDFKNHLNVIRTYIGKDNDDGQRYIREINNEAKEQSEYLKWKNPIFGALIQRKMSEAKKKQIDFKAVPGGFDKMFPLEDYQMASIIMNLLDNAFEATVLLPSDQRHVYLEMGQRENVYISVTNTGIIQTEIIAKMFNKGFSTKGQGRGAGLYAVKCLVTQNNGEIEISPTEDKIEIIISFSPIEERQSVS